MFGVDNQMDKTTIYNYVSHQINFSGSVAASLNPLTYSSILYVKTIN